MYVKLQLPGMICSSFAQTDVLVTNKRVHAGWQALTRGCSRATQPGAGAGCFARSGRSSSACGHRHNARVMRLQLCKHSYVGQVPASHDQTTSADPLTNVGNVDHAGRAFDEELHRLLLL